MKNIFSNLGFNINIDLYLSKSFYCLIVVWTVNGNSDRIGLVSTHLLQMTTVAAAPIIVQTTAASNVKLAETNSIHGLTDRL